MNAEQPALPEANFLNFLSGIASQGLMQLGKIPNPATGEREVNLPFASYTVELLKVLKLKSEGNRSDEESQYLDAMIADIQQQLQQLQSQQQ